MKGQASRFDASGWMRVARRTSSWAASCTLLGALGWLALHHVPGFGPFAADLGRSIVGDAAVARAEDMAYGLQDRFKRFVHRGDAPRAHWSVAELPLTEPETRGTDDTGEFVESPVRSPVRAAESSDVRAFRPKDVGPLYPEQAAEGDGRWVRAQPDSDVAYKTLLHPDADRSFSELFVVALDLSRLQLRAVAGTLEPENVAPGAEALERTGRVPERELGELFAAFNGGFKTRHGGFGMRTDGVTLVPPKARSCTVAQYDDGSLRIGSWQTLPERDAIEWYRQTPGCMVENGQRHPQLKDSKSWGATLDGDTVIRRSAIGLSEDGKTLFVAISNATHADALARGMQHVGAAHVAQLDVNYAYPRFLFYTDGEAGKSIVPLAQGFVVDEGHYLSKASKRDFFYLTQKRAPSLAKSDVNTATLGG